MPKRRRPPFVSHRPTQAFYRRLLSVYTVLLFFFFFPRVRKRLEPTRPSQDELRPTVIAVPAWMPFFLRGPVFDSLRVIAFCLPGSGS